MLIFIRNRGKPSVKSSRNFTMKLSNLNVQMLKKSCLMTHIEHTFIEFEYTTSSIFKNVGFLFDVQR